MSADSLTKEMVLDLSRLMQCLVSPERQIVLFDRISDGDEELEEDLALEEESEEFSEDIDSVFGEGVYQDISQIPITRPNSLQVLV
jgi:hypothetical protein